MGLPHVAVDLERGFVDVDTTVVLREKGWLELLACLPGTREHESILVVEALPSHIHLALVMLGLEPGQPMQWRMEGERVKTERPRGPAVTVSIVEQHDGREVEVPVSRWIIDRQSGQHLPDNTWLFTGSVFYEKEGQTVYHADVSGSVLSIVNFGDEVLARPTDRTNQNDGKAWVPHTPVIPEVGETVIIRLRPVNPPAAGVEQGADR